MIMGDRRFAFCIEHFAFVHFISVPSVCSVANRSLRNSAMGFVTPALLGGAALVALPIVLHLIMRRETKKLLFPALRFVQRRQSVNQHRLRLRHWLLLALRCAIIALL